MLRESQLHVQRPRSSQPHVMGRYPEDCRCKIKPRSAQAEKLIREAREDMAVAEV